MVPDRQKVRTDGRTEGRMDRLDGRTDRRTDDAKTISLRLRRGIKKALKNDQLTGHFQRFFFFFFCPLDPKSEKKSRKSTNKKILALEILLQPLNFLSHFLIERKSD